MNNNITVLVCMALMYLSTEVFTLPLNVIASFIAGIFLARIARKASRYDSFALFAEKFRNEKNEKERNR